MPKELILHIGTTKTGSTSIQNVLDARRDELPAQGAYWPATHDAKRHLLLALANSNSDRFHEMLGNPVWQGMEPAARLEAYRTEFEAEIRGLPASIDRVIISAEQFSEMLRSKYEIRQLRRMLKDMFTKITVVIYLRRQDSHYASMYAQMLRMGNLHEPDMDGVRIGFNFDYDYHDLLGRWIAIFGEDSMMPRLFERTAANKFDVVDDFFDVCRIKLPPSADDAKRASNPSMNLTGQRVLLRVGEVFERTTGTRMAGGVLWNKIAEAITAVAPGSGWQPTQAQAAAFLARFAQSNEAVRARWFPERTTLFSEDLSKLPVEPVPEDAEAGFDAACRAMLDVAQVSLKRELSTSLQVAKLAETAGDFNRMKAALVHVIRVDQRNLPARLQLAQHHINQGNLAAARGNLNAGFKVAPSDPALRRLDAKLTALEEAKEKA